MNCSFAVTKYPVVSIGTLEWEIQDVGFHFPKCDFCWQGDQDYHRGCRSSGGSLESPSMNLIADNGNRNGNGKQSKWHFRLLGKSCGVFAFSLHFDGLFGSDGTLIEEPLSFHFDATVQKSMWKETTTILTTYGTASGKTATVDVSSVEHEELRSIWLDGKLKIIVKIRHLSDLVNQAQPDPFLDSTDSEGVSPVPVSMPSCYGNLVNNSDMSDFTIICDDSTFRAHKLILSVRSPVFRAMLESGMTESVQNEVEIEDMSIETVELMLEYIYKGAIQTFPLDLKEKIQLLDCAEKYELKGLKSICMSKLFSNPPSERTLERW